MSRHLLLATALLTATTAATCGGDDETTRAEQARQLAEDAGLDTEVQDWLALAAGDPDADYRIAYGELVVTQEDGERRVDAGEGGEAAVSADLGAFDERAIELLVDQLREARDDYAFEVENRRMLGVTARCLVTTPKDGGGDDGVFCVSDAGAILLLEGATGNLTATEYTN